MLGDKNAPNTQALLSLIDAQNKETVCTWCMDYVEARVLPIFEKLVPGDERPHKALGASRAYLAGQMPFFQAKPIIWYGTAADAHKPIAQAAERALGQAASLARHPSRWHAIAVYFYAAAALAYDRLGLTASDDAYNAIADEVCVEMTAALRAASTEGAE
jgi:hypothetical protein